MSEWAKRSEIGKYPATLWSDIWDGDGWQINKAIEPREKPYLLLDAVMPSWVPASSVMGSFETLEEAMEEARRLGKPDWSDVMTDEEFYADDAMPVQSQPEGA